MGQALKSWPGGGREEEVSFDGSLETDLRSPADVHIRLYYGG